MVEVPGGSAVGGRSNQSRPPHNTLVFSRGLPRKSREARDGKKKQVPTDSDAPVSQPLISWFLVLISLGWLPSASGCTPFKLAAAGRDPAALIIFILLSGNNDT